MRRRNVEWSAVSKFRSSACVSDKNGGSNEGFEPFGYLNEKQVKTGLNNSTLPF
jgi:hypothetical protein